MTVSLEKYNKVFHRLIENDETAQVVRQDLVLCTDETYESAKTCGFKPVVVDPKKLDVMQEDAQALTMAYALGKALDDKDRFFLALTQCLDPRHLKFYTPGVSDEEALMQSSENTKKAQQALVSTVKRMIQAGYSLGDALNNYYELGYELDPVIILKLSQYYKPEEPDIPLGAKRMPVCVGTQSPRYAIKKDGDNFVDSRNPQEYDKMMQVYYLALDKELEMEFHATPLERDPDFKKLCQVVDKKFEELGDYMRLYKMQDTQLEHLEKSSRNKFYRGMYLMLDSPKRQKQSVDERAFVALQNILIGSITPPKVLVKSSSKIYIIPWAGKDFKKQVLTEIVTTFLQASYTLSSFLEKSDKLPVQEKLDIIQIALTQKKVKLSGEEEKKLMTIGINLKNQPEDPKNLGGQSGENGSRGNPGKQ